MSFGALVVCFLSASPAVRALPGAEVVVYVPKLSGLEGLGAFMAHAGKDAVLFRPSSWREELHPFLFLEPRSHESFSKHGLDLAKPATLSLAGTSKVSCMALKDPKLFQLHADEKLGALGQPWSGKVGGLLGAGAMSGDRLVLGYVLKGKEECSFGDGNGAHELSEKVASLLSRGSAGGPEWKAQTQLPGQVFISTSQVLVGLNGDEDKLEVAGLTRAAVFPEVRPQGTSPFAEAAPRGGLLFARMRLKAQDLLPAAKRLASSMAGACPACDEGVLGEVARALSPLLTGHVFVLVERFRFKGPTRSLAARYFAVKHAAVAEVTRPGEVAQALERLLGLSNARKTEDGVALVVPEGEMRVGVRAGLLYAANDPTAVDRAFASLEGKRPGPAPHGADFSVDAPAVARAFGQLSLFDMLGAPEVASLFAMATELGPLMKSTESLSGWADSTPEGTLRFGVGWKLGQAPPRPEAAGR